MMQRLGYTHFEDVEKSKADVGPRYSAIHTKLVSIPLFKCKTNLPYAEEECLTWSLDKIYPRPPHRPDFHFHEFW